MTFGESTDRRRWAIIARTTAAQLAEHRALLARLESDGARYPVRRRLASTIDQLQRDLLDAQERAAGITPPEPTATRRRPVEREHAALDRPR